MTKPTPEEEPKDDWPEGMLRRAQEAMDKHAPVKPTRQDLIFLPKDKA